MAESAAKLVKRIEATVDLAVKSAVEELPRVRSGCCCDCGCVCVGARLAPHASFAGERGKSRGLARSPVESQGNAVLPPEHVVRWGKAFDEAASQSWRECRRVVQVFSRPAAAQPPSHLLLLLLPSQDELNKMIAERDMQGELAVRVEQEEAVLLLTTGSQVAARCPRRIQ